MSITIRDMTEDDLKKMMDDHLQLNPERPIRHDIRAALDRYAQEGMLLGDFLTAVVENNLMQALGRADSYNRATIHQICSYIYNELPSTCHGSPEKVAKYYAEFHSEEPNE